MEVAMRMCRKVNSPAYRIATLKDLYKPDKENGRKLTQEEKEEKRAHFRPIDVVNGEAEFPASLVENTVIQYELQQVIFPVMKTCPMYLDVFFEEVDTWKNLWGEGIESFMDILIRTPDSKRMYVTLRRTTPPFKSEKKMDLDECDFDPSPCQEFKATKGFMQTCPPPMHVSTFYAQWGNYHNMTMGAQWEQIVEQEFNQRTKAKKTYGASQEITQMTTDIAYQIVELQKRDKSMTEEMVSDTIEALRTLNSVRVKMAQVYESKAVDDEVECSFTTEVLKLNALKHTQTFVMRNGKLVDSDMGFQEAYDQLQATTYLSDAMTCILTAMKGHFCTIRSYILSYLQPLFEK